MAIINQAVLNCLKNNTCPQDGGVQWMIAEVTKNPQAYEQALGRSLPDYINNKINGPSNPRDISEINVLYNGANVVGSMYALNNKKRSFSNTPPAGMQRNDKFMHAYYNCLPAQSGLLGKTAIKYFADRQERTQVKEGQNTQLASEQDQFANALGRSFGYNNPDKDCFDMVQKVYPRYVPK